MATTEIPQMMSATADVPQEMLSDTDELPAKALPVVASMMPPAKAGKDPHKVKLPPCPGKQETCNTEMPLVVPELPTSLQMPEEQLSQQVPRGSCSIHSWQERATNHLDAVPGQETGTEAFIDRHSHQGLLVHQLFSWPASSTAMKDRALLLGRGQREVMLESMLYQKYRKEMLEEICAQQMPMESVSIMHHDYRAEDFQFMPLHTSQDIVSLLPTVTLLPLQHNYFMEQPCSFWLEQAHILPGVTSIVNRNSPFRKNAAFSTPITEYLEQPLPCTP